MKVEWGAVPILCRADHEHRSMSLDRRNPFCLQPMILAHDRSGFHVFAGTWQSPTNL